MRTTIDLDDEIYQQAVKATGISEPTQLIHMGLTALIREKAAERLTRLHGAIKKAKAPRRRRITMK